MENKKIELKNNIKYKIDGLALLKNIPDESSKMIMFDPQYRGIMEKMKYGNEGARQIERAKLPQMNEELIINFIKEEYRILKTSGYLFLWVDKYHLCDGVKHWLPSINKKEGLEIVDMIVWDKDKIGMGYRTRRKSEYLLVIQKLPKLAKKTWKNHSIPDVWKEKLNNGEKNHPHKKPKKLIKELIEAVTEPGDLIIDPAAGSFVVTDMAEETGREAIATDIMTGEVE